MATTTFGNGGIFCWYSYISPLMNRIAGFAPSEITMLMVLAGGSMCVGNLLGGKLADRYTPGKTILGVQAVMIFGLLTTFFLASYPGIAVLMLCVCTAWPVRSVCTAATAAVAFFQRRGRWGLAWYR